MWTIDCLISLRISFTSLSREKRYMQNLILKGCVKVWLKTISLLVSNSENYGTSEVVIILNPGSLLVLTVTGVSVTMIVAPGFIKARALARNC